MTQLGGRPMSENTDRQEQDQRVNSATLNFTLAEALASDLIREGDRVVISDRANGEFNAVLASTVTPNTFNIIQLVGVPTLALDLDFDGVAHIVQWGAIADSGTTNNSIVINHILTLAKGADATGVGRSVFEVYAPVAVGNYYGIEDTLLVDGTHGIIIRSNGALVARSVTDEEAAIRWTGSSSLPVFQIKGGAGTPSNPNFHITLKDITIAGHTTKLDPTATPPATIALAGVYFGTLAGDVQNTLLRNVLLDNAVISDCRFGVYSDNPGGSNTDHAKIVIRAGRIHNNAEQGIHWGTGNAVLTLDSVFVEGNGWGSDHYPADAFSAEIGANVYCKSGYIDIISYTSAGLGDTKPIDADIYQANGRVSINGAWSDTHGFFFFQEAATISDGASQPSMLTGIRHFEGSMDDTNTPVSMRIRVPGTMIASSMLHGDMDIVSGLSGSPICVGVNFSTGHGFTGDGVDTQRSLINLGNSGNEAQILTGGADSGVDLAHVGVLNPQYLQMGVHSAGDTQSRAIRQVLGGAASDSGFTEFFDAATGGMVRITNGFLSATSPFTITPMKIGLVVYMIFGQGTPLGMRFSFSADGSTPITLSSFSKSMEIIAQTGTGNSCLKFPVLGSDPSTPSTDFWEGAVYYNSTTNKLRVNTGASTWVDLH